MLNISAANASNTFDQLSLTWFVITSSVSISVMASIRLVFMIEYMCGLTPNLECLTPRSNMTSVSN